MTTLPSDYVITPETKIHKSFTTAQFNVEGYEIKAKPGQDKYGGGLIEFVRRGLICKGLRDYELKHSPCWCSELTVTNKKWICYSIYTPPESRNLSMFLKKLTSLSKPKLKYENLLIMGDFHIEVKNKHCIKYHNLPNF